MKCSAKICSQYNLAQFSGVLVVYVHSADNLNSDAAQCNPYCMLFNNRKKVKAICIFDRYFRNICRAQHEKMNVYINRRCSGNFQVKTTHYVRSTTSPVWDCRAQFLVQDYTQVSLSFVIYSWNISKSVDTDMLGLAMLSLSQVIQWSFSKLDNFAHRGTR